MIYSCSSYEVYHPKPNPIALGVCLLSVFHFNVPKKLPPKYYTDIARLTCNPSTTIIVAQLFLLCNVCCFSGTCMLEYA